MQFHEADHRDAFHACEGRNQAATFDSRPSHSRRTMLASVFLVPERRNRRKSKISCACTVAGSVRI